MSPSGFSARAIKGLLIYTEACYEELEQEMLSGKHADYKAAIRHERCQIQKALDELHINEEGKLVKRPK
ncbi:hypothetical protein H0X32_03705 [Patescibacteria group bacterium]|nr:hypothetical protein [Patescibacteria group bacterium]